MNPKSRSRFAMTSWETLTELGEGGNVPSEIEPDLTEDGDRNGDGDCVSPESLPDLTEDGDHDLQSFTIAITQTH